MDIIFSVLDFFSALLTLAICLTGLYLIIYFGPGKFHYIVRDLMQIHRFWRDTKHGHAARFSLENRAYREEIARLEAELADKRARQAKLRTVFDQTKADHNVDL